MVSDKLAIARGLIETLAGHHCSKIGTEPGVGDMTAVSRIIEAARINYVLPSFCAEKNNEARHCIDCIVEHKPPAVCRRNIESILKEELDIEWDSD